MIKDKSCIFHNKQTYFQELLITALDNSPLKSNDDTVCSVESFNSAVQQTAWNAIPCSNIDTNIEYSFSIKDKLAKRKLKNEKN